MEHALLNSRTLFALFAFVVWLIQKIAAARRKAAAVRQGKPLPSGPPGTPADPEEEARARRVREAVARKIAGRRILMMPSARLDAPAPPPLRPQVDVPAPVPATALAPLPPPSSFTRAPAPVEAPMAGRSGSSWLEELREPQTARRAILLREIMGPPVGLR